MNDYIFSVRILLFNIENKPIFLIRWDILLFCLKQLCLYVISHRNAILLQTYYSMMIEYNECWNILSTIMNHISWSIFLASVLSIILIGGGIAPLLKDVGIIITHLHARVSDDIIEIHKQLEIRYAHSLDFLTFWIFLYILWVVLIDKLNT